MSNRPERRWFLKSAGYTVGFEARGGVDFMWRRVPGTKDRRSRPIEPADLEDPEIAACFQAWCDAMPGPVGHPLSALGLSPGIVEELEHLGIESVEALAALQDGYTSRVPTGVTLKRQAAAFVEKADREEYVSPATRAELGKLQAQIDELRARLNEGGANV